MEEKIVVSHTFIIVLRNTTVTVAMKIWVETMFSAKNLMSILYHDHARLLLNELWPIINYLWCLLVNARLHYYLLLVLKHNNRFNYGLFLNHLMYIII